MYTYHDPEESIRLAKLAITKKEIDEARHRFRRHYRFFKAELEMENFFTASRYKGWKYGGQIALARQALYQTTRSLAKKLGTTPAHISQIERREKHGSINIKKLSEMADALDCDLVYAIVPKSKERFSAVIFNQVVEEAKNAKSVKACNPRNRAAAIAAAARVICLNPAFRRAKGWSRITDQMRW